MPLESLNINRISVDSCINYLTSVLTCVLFLPPLITSLSGRCSSHVRKFLPEVACSERETVVKTGSLNSSFKDIWLNGIGHVVAVN